MFDAGFSELVLLFVIGLLILGPERLPRVASQIGRWVGRARRTASQLRHQLEREIALNDIRRPPPRKPPPEKSTTASAETETKTKTESEAGDSANDGGAAEPSAEAGEPPRDKDGAEQ